MFPFCLLTDPLIISPQYLSVMFSAKTTLKSASNRTIMVVDDNNDLVEIVRLTLESKGFNVRCAYNGQELH